LNIFKTTILITTLIFMGCSTNSNGKKVVSMSSQDAKFDLDKTKTFDNIIFELDSSKLLPSAKKRLDEIAKMIRLRTDIPQIIINGHTDELGTELYNDQLGYERAQVVKNYLTEKGIMPDRIQLNSFGEKRTMHADAGQNRRVEIVVNDLLVTKAISIPAFNL